MAIVGPMEMMLAAVLGVLAVAAAVSLAVTLLALVALAVAPALARAARRLQQWRWRDWHPRTDWVPEPAPEPKHRAGPPLVDGVTVVSSNGDDAAVQLVSAHVSPSGGDRADAPGPTLTTVRARLAPTGILDLPANADSDVLVYVVAGEADVGPRQVRPGQLAVVEAGDRVSVAAGRHNGSHPLEVLLVGGLPRRTPPAVEAAPVRRRRAWWRQPTWASGLRHGWARVPRRPHRDVRDGTVTV